LASLLIETTREETTNHWLLSLLEETTREETTNHWLLSLLKPPGKKPPIIGFSPY
jgi:hypothetical protein